MWNCVTSVQLDWSSSLYSEPCQSLLCCWWQRDGQAGKRGRQSTEQVNVNWILFLWKIPFATSSLPAAWLAAVQVLPAPSSSIKVYGISPQGTFQAPGLSGCSLQCANTKLHAV